MESFQQAKMVRLKNRHEKYLYADEDEHHVAQDRNGSSPNARWTVEPVPAAKGQQPHFLRFKSRYGRYLTASNEPFLLGMTGRKVLQTQPDRLDSSVEWEPVRESGHKQLVIKTRYGHYLRAHGGLPPWRNSVTHDLPQGNSASESVLWDVEIVQVLTPRGDEMLPKAGSMPAPKPPPAGAHRPTASMEAVYVAKPPPPPPAVAEVDPRLSKLESSTSFDAPLHKVEGRTIHYHIADDKGNVDENEDGHSFAFDGTSLEELTDILQKQSGLSDIIICSRNPLNQKLYPLRLQLPPNNASMHIVLVKESSKVAKTFS